LRSHKRSIGKFATWREKRQKEQRRKHTHQLNSIEAAKLAYKKASQTVDATKLATMIEGAKALELYGNLLSNEARQPWEKIIQAQMTKCPWENIQCHS
jgi:hypothetical protein